MAILQCECGQKLTVPDNLAGRMGKCPACGRKIRIPAPQAAPAPGGAPGRVPVAAPVSTARSRYRPPRGATAQWKKYIVPIMAGALILATIIIPWAAQRGLPGVSGKVVMSWNLIKEMKGRDCSFLIGAWVIGAAAIAVSFCVRGLALRLSHVGMGLLGLILFWVAISARGTDLLRGFKTTLMVLPGKWTGCTQWWYWFLLLTFLITAINARLRLGARPAIRAAVGVLAGGLAIWTIVRFFTTISDFTNMPKSYKDEMTLYLITMLAAMVVMVTVCVLALVDIVSLRVDKKSLSRGALRAAYGALGVVFLVFAVIFPLHVIEKSGLILYMANSYLVIAAVLAIFSSGVIGLTALLLELADKRRAAGPAPAPVPTAPAGPQAPPPPADDLDTRLRKLKALLDSETISQEEYDTERRRILSDI